ncbi:MAG: hypothetical protein DRR19_24220 [Candidatus Parabeggiatoa sp. nov. 1]|nr:MAG: hypothetical protein DRR19_24220 [Gammaproteobacteria bacterium]
MKIIYDIEVDVLRILFNDSLIEESDEEKEGVIFDYDKQGRLVGLEILDASQQMSEPHAMEVKYAITPFSLSGKQPTLASVAG